MAKYLIDANLPQYFSHWNSDDFVHVNEISTSLSDEEIWDYAKLHGLTIVTKDVDFSLLASFSPAKHPKVIHFRLGNMKLKELHAFVAKYWNEIVEVTESHKIMNVYKNKIEGIL